MVDEAANFNKGASWCTPHGLAERWDMPVAKILGYARKGLFVGARFDRQTWQWRIPLPVQVRR